MGLDPMLIHGSVRFSLGHRTTDEDIDWVLEKLPPIVEKLRSISAVSA
jgi:cysteine desulfurase